MTSTTPSPIKALQEIPPFMRAILYWTGWIVGTVSQGVTLVWVSVAAASPNVSMPVWLIIASTGLGFLQSQLNALAGANLPSYADVIEGEVAPPPVEYDARRLQPRHRRRI